MYYLSTSVCSRCKAWLSLRCSTLLYLTTIFSCARSLWDGGRDFAENTNFQVILPKNGKKKERMKRSKKSKDWTDIAGSERIIIVRSFMKRQPSCEPSKNVPKRQGLKLWKRQEMQFWEKAHECNFADQSQTFIKLILFFWFSHHLDARFKFQTAIHDLPDIGIWTDFPDMETGKICVCGGLTNAARTRE